MSTGTSPPRLCLGGRHVRLEPLRPEHAAPLLAVANESRSTYAFTLVPEDLAGAAKLLLCTHAFEVWEVFRVTWRTHAKNERSRAAILRLGAQFEGAR